jgi:DNA-binding PadR family transcriptional regulator
MMQSMDDPRRFLPLTPQQFHILLALTDGHLHGYAIIRDVAERTEGTVRLGTGTLYTAVARLETLALVEESDRRPIASKDDERRRYYRLTAMGKAVLRAETERLETMVRHARRKGVPAMSGRPEWSRAK